MITRARFNYGLRWKSARPHWCDIREAARTAAAGAFIVCAILLGTAIDYAVEQRAEADHQAALAKQTTYALAECLNGTAQFVAEDKSFAILCGKHYEVKN